MIDYDVDENDYKFGKYSESLKFRQILRAYRVVFYIGRIPENFQKQLDSLQQLMGDKRLPPRRMEDGI